MLESTIKEIREAEQKAEEIIANAKSQSNRLLEEAKREAVNLESGMIEEVQAKADKAREAAQIAGRQKLDRALEEAGEEIRSLKKDAKSREKEAVEAVISGLV